MAITSTESPASVAASIATELRAVVGKLKRRFREQGTLGDFTASQISVLSLLERDGPATVSHLAKQEGMRPQSMGAIIAALEEAGLLAGTPDPNDGRQTLITLTQECEERIRTARAFRQDWLTQAIQTHLSPEEQADLETAVELLKRIANS